MTDRFAFLPSEMERSFQSYAWFPWKIQINCVFVSMNKDLLLRTSLLNRAPYLSIPNQDSPEPRPDSVRPSISVPKIDSHKLGSRGANRSKAVRSPAQLSWLSWHGGHKTRGEDGGMQGTQRLTGRRVPRAWVSHQNFQAVYGKSLGWAKGLSWIVGVGVRFDEDYLTDDVWDDWRLGMRWVCGGTGEDLDWKGKHFWWEGLPRLG
jgi:hypothetical protein